MSPLKDAEIRRNIVPIPGYKEGVYAGPEPICMRTEISMGSTKSLCKLLLAAAVTLPFIAFSGVQAHAAVIISVGFAPPVLPVYAQPICPGPGYLWTPGYWAYGPDGYYWVPGTWVVAPAPGLLWTPGYWGWGDGVYVWHGGYWGPHVGFYGGINYGFGYYGTGFVGGRWE